MDKVINFSLISHPMNWIIIMLMVLIAGVAFNFVMKYQTAP